MKKSQRIAAFPVGTQPLAVIFCRDKTLASAHPSRTPRIEVDDAMFQAFADIKTTAEGISKFREKNLIEDDDRIIVIDLDTWMPLLEAYQTNLVQNWTAEIQAMRRGIDLWNMIRAHDTEQLKKIIKWENDPSRGLSVIYDSQFAGVRTTEMIGSKVIEPEVIEPEVIEPEVIEPEVIVSEFVNLPVMRRMSAGDTIGPAKLYLERLLNERLEDGVQPSILTPDMHRSIIRIIPPKEFSLTLVPKNFIAAVWLQFAEAIDGNKRHVRCHLCRSWFELSRGKTHRDRKYCSDLCKVNHFRKKKEAKQLAANGMEPGKIAEVLDLEVETVNDMISPKGEEK